jgi:hypothetical protein
VKHLAQVVTQDCAERMLLRDREATLMNKRSNFAQERDYDLEQKHPRAKRDTCPVEVLINFAELELRKSSDELIQSV